jgi:hypothetical protein
MKLTFHKDRDWYLFVIMFEPLKGREVDIIIGGKPERSTFLKGHLNAFGQLSFTLRAADGSEREVPYSTIWSMHVL